MNSPNFCHFFSITKQLFDYLWPLRTHPESLIRRGVLTLLSHGPKRSARTCTTYGIQYLLKRTGCKVIFSNFLKIFCLKVALLQKIFENFSKTDTQNPDRSIDKVIWTSLQWTPFNAVPLGVHNRKGFSVYRHFLKKFLLYFKLRFFQNIFPEAPRPPQFLLYFKTF